MAPPARKGEVPSKMAPEGIAKEGLPFLVKWINYLCGGYQGWTPLTMSNIFEDLKSGIVLCRLVERLVPGANFATGLYPNPKTRRTCILNIEAALTVIFRQGVHAANVASSDDIYEGHVVRVIRFLYEVFEKLQMKKRDVRRTFAKEVLTGMQECLQQYGQPLRQGTMDDANEMARENRAPGNGTQDIAIGNRKPGQMLCDDFADGSRVMNLLNYHKLVRTEEMEGLHENCVKDEYFTENAKYTNHFLMKAGCPVLLSAAEWRRPPSPFPDTLVFQLYVIWQFLVRKDSRMDGTINSRVTTHVKEQAVTHFLAWLLQKYQPTKKGNLEGKTYLSEAFLAIAGTPDGHFERKTFTKFLKDKDYDGDRQYIWDCISFETRAGGFVDFEGFQHLEKLVDMSAVDDMTQTMTSLGDTNLSDTAGAGGTLKLQNFDFDWDVSEVQLVVDFAHPGQEWPPKSIVSLCDDRGEEARFRSAAEERAMLYAEDQRRQAELEFTNDRAKIAQANAVRVAAAAGAAAAVQAADEAAATIPQVPQTPEKATQDMAFDVPESVHQGPAPTTSIDARVVLPADDSQKQVFVQTTVVYNEEIKQDQLVLEVREKGPNGMAVRAPLAKIDVSQILAVHQMESADVSVGPSKFVPFVVAMRPEADLLGTGPIATRTSLSGSRNVKALTPVQLRERGMDEATRGSSASLLHRGATGDGGNGSQTESVLLVVLAGPSPWMRREGRHFFDELRILQKFLQGAASSPPGKEDF